MDMLKHADRLSRKEINQSVAALTNGRVKANDPGPQPTKIQSLVPYLDAAGQVEKMDRTERDRIEGFFHQITTGETIMDIASGYGFVHWQVIWEHDKNKEVKDQRKNPWALKRGDQLYIPPFEGAFLEGKMEAGKEKVEIDFKLKKFEHVANKPSTEEKKSSARRAMRAAYEAALADSLALKKLFNDQVEEFTIPEGRNKKKWWKEKYYIPPKGSDIKDENLVYIRKHTQAQTGPEVTSAKLEMKGAPAKAVADAMKDLVAAVAVIADPELTSTLKVKHEKKGGTYSAFKNAAKHASKTAFDKYIEKGKTADKKAYTGWPTLFFTSDRKDKLNDWESKTIDIDSMVASRALLKASRNCRVARKALNIETLAYTLNGSAFTNCDEAITQCKVAFKFLHYFHKSMTYLLPAADQTMCFLETLKKFSEEWNKKAADFEKAIGSWMETQSHEACTPAGRDMPCYRGATIDDDQAIKLHWDKPAKNNDGNFKEIGEDTENFALHDLSAIKIGDIISEFKKKVTDLFDAYKTDYKEMKLDQDSGEQELEEAATARKNEEVEREIEFFEKHGTTKTDSDITTGRDKRLAALIDHLISRYDNPSWYKQLRHGTSSKGRIVKTIHDEITCMRNQVKTRKTYFLFGKHKQRKEGIGRYTSKGKYGDVVVSSAAVSGRFVWDLRNETTLDYFQQLIRKPQNTQESGDGTTIHDENNAPVFVYLSQSDGTKPLFPFELLPCYKERIDRAAHQVLLKDKSDEENFDKAFFKVEHLFKSMAYNVGYAQYALQQISEDRVITTCSELAAYAKQIGVFLYEMDALERNVFATLAVMYELLEWASAHMDMAKQVILQFHRTMEDWVYPNGHHYRCRVGIETVGKIQALSSCCYGPKHKKNTDMVPSDLNSPHKKL